MAFWDGRALLEHLVRTNRFLDSLAARGILTDVGNDTFIADENIFEMNNGSDSAALDFYR